METKWQAAILVAKVPMNGPVELRVVDFEVGKDPLHTLFPGGYDEEVQVQDFFEGRPIRVFGPPDQFGDDEPVNTFGGVGTTYLLRIEEDTIFDITGADFRVIERAVEKWDQECGRKPR